MQPRIDSNRLSRELAALAAFSEPPPGITRVLYSAEDMAARAYLKGLMHAAGLMVREDALGNTFARWQGTDDTLAAIASGSHIDAIPHAGQYDGTVGVLGALEAIRALKASGFVPRRSIELILFTSEEPTRFGLGCLGSRALSGALTVEALLTLRDDRGLTLDEARQQVGFVGRLADVRLTPGHYAAFLELHIEQGPILERQGKDIGIVNAIAAPATLHVTLVGDGGHAGAVLMSARNDALSGAAEVVLAIERYARDTGAADTVATVGILEVFPGAVNSIPSRVFFTVDVRDTERLRRDHVVENITNHIATTAKRRRLSAETTLLNADPPTHCDAGVRAVIRAACAELALSSLELVSRAYHDTLFMAQLCPVGMIFIPCQGGVSHRPDEYASPEAIARGVAVLARALAALASR
jgi:N-carbamoyl-L-amino-acid hydrolase